MCSKCVAVLIICGLVLPGCQVSTRERLLMRHEPTGRAEVRNAPYNGHYRLYAGAHPRPTTRTATPVLSAELKKGEPIGFARGDSGRLLAVVRGDQRELPGGAYSWTIQADPGQIDPVTTTVAVVAVALAVAIGVALAVSAAAPGGWLSASALGGL